MGRLQGKRGEGKAEDPALPWGEAEPSKEEGACDQPELYEVSPNLSCPLVFANTVPMPCRTREVISAGSSWSSVTGASALWCVVGKVTENSPLDFLPLLTSAAWILPPERQSCAPRRGTTCSPVTWKNSHS